MKTLKQFYNSFWVNFAIFLWLAYNSHRFAYSYATSEHPAGTLICCIFFAVLAYGQVFVLTMKLLFGEKMDE